MIFIIDRLIGLLIFIYTITYQVNGMTIKDELHVVFNDRAPIYLAYIGMLFTGIGVLSVIISSIIIAKMYYDNWQNKYSNLAPTKTIEITKVNIRVHITKNHSQFYTFSIGPSMIF